MFSPFPGGQAGLAFEMAVEAGKGFESDVVSDIQNGPVGSGQQRGRHLDSQAKEVFQGRHTEGVVEEPAEGGDADAAAFSHIVDTKGFGVMTGEIFKDRTDSMQ